MTDWSGHIDALVGAGIIITLQAIINLIFYRKLKAQRSIIYYGENEHKPSRHDSSSGHSSSRIDRVGNNFKR